MKFLFHQYFSQGPDQSHLEPPPTPVIPGTLFNLTLGHTRKVVGSSLVITWLSVLLKLILTYRLLF